LKVLGLQEGSRADALAERTAREQRCSGDMRSDDGAGALDVREGYGQGALPKGRAGAGISGPAWIRTKDQQIMSPPL
jgi:hypothetical protein